MRPFLIIIGVQKSGTTLLNRLVQDHGVARTVFQTEGNDFWGNEPPFEPTAAPIGALVQRSGGDGGHQLGADLATEDVRKLLLARLAALDNGADPIVNKNPYLTVSAPFVRALFPSAVIVAMVRDPVANAYSLAKKHVPHKGRGLAPAEGWWGVKPAGWRALVEDDKRLQSARQWDAVNRQLLRDRTAIDRVISYRQLCEDPSEVLRDLHMRLHGTKMPTKDIAPLECLDHEHTTGAGLRSKNRYFKELGTLAIPSDEPIEFPAWTDDQADGVRTICAETWEELGGR